jgi:hypothetical protein
MMGAGPFPLLAVAFVKAFRADDIRKRRIRLILAGAVTILSLLIRFQILPVR